MNPLDAVPIRRHPPRNTMSYYSPDALLTDAQRMPCTFDNAVRGLGFLDPSSTSATISAGTTLQLPIWLAEILAVSQRMGTSNNVVSLDIPPALSPRVLNALKADPRTVELRQLATHFYALGERVLALWDEPQLEEVLIQVSMLPQPLLVSGIAG